MIYIGIDPGQKGAWAWINTGTGASGANPLPFVGKELDVVTLCADIAYCRSMGAIKICVEKQFVMPKQGAVSGFRVGLEYGRLIGALAALRCSATVVPAKTWKAAMLPGENKADKSASIRVARRLFPNVGLRRTAASKKDDHNMAEALLIAEYGRRLLGDGSYAPG